MSQSKTKDHISKCLLQAEKSSKRKSNVEISPSEVQSNAKRSRLSRDERQYDRDLNKALTLSMDPEPKSIMSDNNRVSNDRDVPIGVSDETNQQSLKKCYLYTSCTSADGLFAVSYTGKTAFVNGYSRNPWHARLTGVYTAI